MNKKNIKIEQVLVLNIFYDQKIFMSISPFNFEIKPIYKKLRFH